jgi:hypothetical protein
VDLSHGIWCVLLPYDQGRFQLKLVRHTGTIKSDLFAGYASALAASQRWRDEIEVPREEWPSPTLDRQPDGVTSHD